jgi:phytoene dehydrogenase-like protein
VNHDAIVIGGGHNGLVCAAYLARAGMRVLVLEARESVGGMSSTRALAPGVRAPALAHTVGRLSPVVARELGLRAHGLMLVQPDVRLFAPQLDGRGLTLWGDARRSASDLAQTGLASPNDAHTWVDRDARLRTLARALWPILRRAPPDLADVSLGRRARSLAAAARTDPQLVRAMPMAVSDVVAEWFESDALQAAVAARGVLYTALGPRMPGTGAVLLTDAASSDGGLAGSAVFARGGPGAVADALAAAIRQNGGEIRTASRVVRVKSRADRASGVMLDGGEEADAAIVVSALDPKQTLLDLLEPEVLGPHLSWRAGNIRQNGATAKVNFALQSLPVFPGAYDDAHRLRGRIIIAPSMGYLDLAARPARYGEAAQQPLLEITIPSLVDPTLVDTQRAGKVRHVMSVVAQAAPYELRTGTWDERRSELGDIVTRTIDSFAPGFADVVVDRQVLTPLDIEREYGARGGHAMHAEVALDQWFEWRPMHGYGGYRMPLDGFYLAASGAHPGGGVTGMPGRLAAQRIIDDMKQGRLRVAA